MSKEFKGITTKTLHAGKEFNRAQGLTESIEKTSAFKFHSTEHAANLFALKEKGSIYSRIGNPTQDILEARLAEVEGGAASVCLASGTTAIFYTVINICQAGDEVVASKHLYGGTFTQFASILPQFNIKVHLVDFNSNREVEEAINEKTRLLFTEVIGNPSLSVVDIEEISKIAKKHNIPLAVDSTFTPPTLFRPIEKGADIVIHSLTKWISGVGSVMGGAVIDAGTFDWSDKKFSLYNEPDGGYHGLRFGHDLGEAQKVAFAVRMRVIPLRNLGGCISADSAWEIMQGLKTLHLRVKKHSENALKVAKWLENQNEVAWVSYPGLESGKYFSIACKQFEGEFGGMVVFGLKNGEDKGQKFIDALKLFSHVANVGDVRSLAIHPASTTHSQLSKEDLELAGSSKDLVRLSIGIEEIEDILKDLQQALKSI